jgi:clan AA aspartic protease (TIGR02281 family)
MRARRLWVKPVIGSLAVLLAGSKGYADTLHLRNGRSIEGIIKRQDDQSIELEVSGGTVTFKRSEVGSMDSASGQRHDELRVQWERQNRLAYEQSLAQKLKDSEVNKIDYSADESRITVNAVLNGKVEVTLVLDTGAAMVTLQPSIAKKLGLVFPAIERQFKAIVADGREVPVEYAVLDRMSVAGMDVPGVEVAVMKQEVDHEHLQDGLLGMSFLKQFNFKIDRRSGKLILERI